MTKVKTSKSPKTSKKSFLKLEDFSYLDSLGFPLPQIVLGIKHNREWFYSDSPPRRHTFKTDAPKFRNIVHETSGASCDQFYITGAFLEPKSVEVLRGLQELAAKWLNSNVGLFGSATLEELNSYEQDLKRLFGASANQSHRNFREGLYPIDLEYLPKITSLSFNLESLDEFIEWESGWDRSAGSINRWTAYILGQNRG